MVKVKPFKLLKKLNLPLYFVTGMLFDYSVYFYWLIVPIMLKSLNASPLIIGLADAVTFVVAGACAPLMGVIADKWKGEMLCLIGGVLQSISCLLTSIYYIDHDGLTVIFIFLVIQGVGLSMFWSPVEVCFLFFYSLNGVIHDLF